MISMCGGAFSLALLLLLWGVCTATEGKWDNYQTMSNKHFNIGSLTVSIQSFILYNYKQQIMNSTLRTTSCMKHSQIIFLDIVIHFQWIS